MFDQGPEGPATGAAWPEPDPPGRSAGNDDLRGGPGADRLRGGPGDDTVRGGEGDDRLRGGAGDDRLAGEEGDDRLIGGGGADEMTGGAGADRFVLAVPPAGGVGADTVADWGDGADRLDLRRVLAGGHAAADILLDDTEVPGATVLRVLGTDLALHLPGTRAGEFDLSALAETGFIEARPPQGAVVLDQVPAYDWYHGCTPTSVASLLGYYDVRGVGDFFAAAGWEEIRFTWNVRDEISSPAHNAKYDPNPDDPALPDPPDAGIADFLGTSEGTLGYGATWLSGIDSGIEAYAAYRGEAVEAWSEPFTMALWDAFTAEIDAGRPMLFQVDSGGDGFIDHTVPVLGYEDRGADGLWYGCYTTWSEEETVAWFRFRPAAPGDAWGVHSVDFVHVLPDEPAVLAAAGGGDALRDADGPAFPPAQPMTAGEAWLA